MIKEPHWKYRITDSKIIKVVRKNEEERDIDAIDLSMDMGFILGVPENISIEDIQINEIYHATFKVYTAKLTPEIEKAYSKLAKESDVGREVIEFLKRSGGYRTLYKFELVELEPL